MAVEKKEKIKIVATDFDTNPKMKILPANKDDTTTGNSKICFDDVIDDLEQLSFSNQKPFENSEKQIANQYIINDSEKQEKKGNAMEKIKTLVENFTRKRKILNQVDIAVTDDEGKEWYQFAEEGVVKKEH
ncbi:hypothetical protein PACTADRAFT_16019 [Pachysolen tannophilus NRRL Y-2460]|uniref:Uncharacterized protein n=1 Tax=Pachysolen tannophilus NRRL Y-2460 TaxID=669874 RepID=A0A1E4TVQ1_PACTA|nr:hypothetical protein PACTADRAFT_16019 [Pachysolen tannophilus NRRL Y-2460]